MRSEAPDPHRTATENGFQNNWCPAKPSNPEPSTSGRSQSNGRQFKRPGILEPDVISSPVAPHIATLVRFNFYGDESSKEVRTTLRGADRNYERPFDALGRVDITSQDREIRRSSSSRWAKGAWAWTFGVSVSRYESQKQ